MAFCQRVALEVELLHFIVMNAIPHNPGILQEQRMIFVEQRTVHRNQVKKTTQRHRAAALNALDFNCLAKLDATIEEVQKLALIGGVDIDVAVDYLRHLFFIREELTMPMDIYVHIWTSEKNRSIAAIEYADDEFLTLFRAHRAQLHILFASLDVPALIHINSSAAGYCDSEFAFIAWLYKVTKETTFIACQDIFHMEWSRIAKCVSAFQRWFFANHSFRVTNALHFWAPSVIRLCILYFGSFCFAFWGVGTCVTCAAVGIAYS